MEPRVVEALTLEAIDTSTMRVTWRGEVSEAAVLAMGSYTMACNEEFGPGSIENCIVDATEGAGISRDGRRAFTQLANQRPWKRVAFLGARFELRVLIEMMSKAMQLLKLEGAELKFFDTEAEALAWFASQRHE